MKNILDKVIDDYDWRARCKDWIKRGFKEKKSCVQNKRIYEEQRRLWEESKVIEEEIRKWVEEILNKIN